MYVSEAALHAIVIKAQPFMIQAEKMQNRGMEIINACFILHRPIAELIGGPIAEPAFHTRSGEPNVWIRERS